MRFRIAITVFFIAALLGCSRASPTEPTAATPVTPVVTKAPAPEPTETPRHGCSGGNCDP